MKYYEHPSLIAKQNDDETLEVFCSSFMDLSDVKFIAPKWYADELMPLLEEISKERFDICYSEDNCDKCTTIDIGNIDIELYHGTDAKIVRMTEEERKMHKSYCKRAIEYLYPLFKEKYYFDSLYFEVDKTNLDKETAHYIDDCLHCYRSMLWGNGFFQYPDNVVYLTSLYKNAKDYAYRNFAGGELGYLAYYMCKAAQSVELPGFDPNSETATAIQYVMALGEQKREPIIFRLKVNQDLDLMYLRRENGEILIGTHEQGFRYIGPIKLDLASAEYLK